MLIRFQKNYKTFFVKIPRGRSRDNQFVRIYKQVCQFIYLKVANKYVCMYTESINKIMNNVSLKSNETMNVSQFRTCYFSVILNGLVIPSDTMQFYKRLSTAPRTYAAR